VYGCKTWSLREEHIVFENVVLRRIGPKRDEVTGENCVTRSIIVVVFCARYYTIK
jgi:hypothetical protein